MNTHFATRGHARKSSAWRALINAVDAVEPYWFSQGALDAFDSRLVGKPFQQAYTGRWYWVEYQTTETGELGYIVRVFDGHAVLMVGTHDSEPVAVGSAMFLAAV